jgi:hypothetical protein
MNNNNDFMRYVLCVLALALCVLVMVSELPEPQQDIETVTITAYCDSYNAETGWFTLIDENGEQWVFQDTGNYAIDRPFEITYLDRDFELISLSNNGQTTIF